MRIYTNPDTNKCRYLVAAEYTVNTKNVSGYRHFHKDAFTSHLSTSFARIKSNAKYISNK